LNLRSLIVSAWRDGLRAARANALPGILLQIAMALILLGYVFRPGIRHGLESIAAIKQESGYFFTFVAASIGAALLPEILKVAVFQRGRVMGANFGNLLFNICLWGGMGMLTDGFYRLQGFWFGEAADLRTIAIKVLVDQLGYTVFVASPILVFVSALRDKGFSPAAIPGILRFPHFGIDVFRIVVPCWGVWVPVVCVIYALPAALQVPVYVLALCFWVLVFTTLTHLKQNSPQSARRT